MPSQRCLQLVSEKPRTKLQRKHRRHGESVLKSLTSSILASPICSYRRRWYGYGWANRYDRITGTTTGKVVLSQTQFMAGAEYYFGGVEGKVG